MNYLRIHDFIIDRAQNRIIEGYVERHHIIPKCLGGSNSKDNIVRLTGKEHYIIHLLLLHIYPNSKKLMHAFWMMSNKMRIKSGKMYKEIRAKISLEMRKNVGTQEAIAKMKNSKKGQKTWLGKTHSKESKIKQSNSAKSRNITIENEALRRDNISKAMKLIKRSQEWKDNISDSKKGEKHPMFGVKGCENPRSKKVLQYNLNGDYIRCWCNTQQISDKLGINYKAINNCLTGKTKSSSGFYWKYNNQ